MQSYYSVIKNNNTTSGEVKVVPAAYKNSLYAAKDEILEEDIIEENEKFDYEEMKALILQEAEKEKQQILKEAYEKAKVIEKEAYEKAYNQGLENGFEDGKNEAINKVLPMAEEEANKIREEANKVLLNCHNDYNKYLKYKEESIIQLSLEIAEKILRKEVKVDGTISDMAKEIIETWRDSESIIIKVNPTHYEEIKNNVPIWKHNYAIQGEIFVIEDEGLEEGNILLEKPSGKAVVGIDVGLEKLKEELIN